MISSKASGLRVSESSDTGFTTRVKADAAMESAKQAELLSVHADRSALTGKPPFNKNVKGKGGGKGGGNRKFPLRLLPQHQQQQPQQHQQQQQQPSASLLATLASSPCQQQSTLPCTNPNKGGKGGKGGKGKGQ